MARETELGFKIKRVLSDNDQWKKIVKETEAFYDKLESNPAEISIGDTKSTIEQLRQIRKEYDKISNNTNSNHGELEFAKTLFDVLEKAESKFGNISVMFKNVNDGTKKYVTGLSNIMQNLDDSSLGVSFLDIGSKFGDLRAKAEELFGTLKSMNTVLFGRFNLDIASMDISGLRDCLNVLYAMQDVVLNMSNIDQHMNEKDFIGRITPDVLSGAIEKAETDLEDLRRLRLDTTAELRERRNLISQFEDLFTWDNNDHEHAKANIHDNEIYQNAIDSIKRYIRERQDIIEQLQNNEDWLFATDGISQYVDKANEEIERLHGLMKELQMERGDNDHESLTNINFSEVVTALNEIKEAIREIKDAFEPLTQAFSNEESAIHAMVTSNVSQLEELINKFKEVHEMVDSLNRKDFNVTNLITQKGNVSESVQAVKNQAKTLLDVVKSLLDASNEVHKTNNDVYQTAMRKSGGVFASSLWDLQNFDPVDLTKKITKSGSEAKLLEHIATLEYYKDTVLRIIKELNKVSPGIIDTDTILSKLNTVQKVSNESAKVQQGNTQQNDIGSFADKIVAERNQIEEELKLIRQQIEEVFNFSTIDPDLSNVQSITERIYQQFVELQTKIKALDFKIETGSFESDILNAANAIKQEGEEAEKAAAQKKEFVDANKNVAAINIQTAETAERAAEGIKKEGEAISKQSSVQSMSEINTTQEVLSAEKQITAEQKKQNELLAIHGISTQNLINALKGGEFPSPSIALTKPDVYSGGYGDATVVFKKSSIDPANNPANKIYGVDAYTPTYPSFGYELNEEGLKKASERTGIEIDRLRMACSGAYANLEEAVGNLAFSSDNLRLDLQKAYLRERGIEIKPVEVYEDVQGRFHTDDEEFNNRARDIITRDGVTFDSIVNDDKLQKEYFDAVDEYVRLYNERFDSWPQAQIKAERVAEFKDRIKNARSDKAIYDEEKAIFEHDQAAIRGELRTIDVGQTNRNIFKAAMEDNKSDYRKYVESVLTEAMVKPFVRGINGQKFDRTPDGIAEAMASYGGKNALYNQNPFMRKDMDDQIFIIGSAKNYKSIAEAEADAARLEKDAPGGHTKLENGDIEYIARSVAQANNIEAQDAFDKIAQAVDGNTTAETIGKALRDSGLTVDDATVDKLAVAAQEAANVKTQYFEAKPQRSLNAEDIAFVSLPKGSYRSDIIKEMLDKQGIPYVDHDVDDKGTREAALIEGMQKFGDGSAIEKAANAQQQLATESQEAAAAMSALKEEAKNLKTADSMSVSAEKLAEQYTNSGRTWSQYARSGLDEQSKLIADKFNKYISTAGINVSDIDTSFLDKSFKTDDGDTELYEVVKLIAKGTNAAGEIVTIIQEYNLASAELEKEATKFHDAINKFDLATAKSTAESQVQELKSQMGSFKIDTTELEAAQKGILDEESFEVFNEKLKNAKQRLAEIKTMLKSSKSLDPLVNSENMMSNLETTVKTYRENIKKFADVEGFDKLGGSLDIITAKLKEFNEAKNKKDGNAMAQAVSDINREIANYNSQLNLVKARQQENIRVAKETAAEEKKRLAEEEAAWEEYNAAKEAEAQKERDIDAAYRSKLAQEALEDEKALLQARKEANEFYEQEEKIRKAQEDAAWKEHKAEQEAAAEKERQINLAFSQKAAQEAAEAERELAQARKEADDYFTAVEKQEQKEEETKKARELNALYRERNTIITAIIKYNNKASTLKTDKAIQRAKEQLELETKRLAAIDEEINKYGEIVNLSKLEQQNDRLTSRLRDSNVTNAINNEQKKDIADVNNLLARRKEIHDNILKLQKQLNDASGDAERQAIQKELDGQNAIYRTLTKQLATYKDIALKRKVTEQDTKFGEQDDWVKAQKNIVDAKSADKSALEDQKQDYKYILSLVEQLFDAQTALYKINTDPTDKIHTAEREKEIVRVKELSMLLKDIYGIDIKNLTGSLDKNALLTQEQKNKLLEQERSCKQDIVDLTAKAADKAAELARKEQQRVNSEAQNYGKADFNRLNKFSESMHASIRELQSGGAISVTLDGLVAEFDEAYTKIEAMRKRFNEDPASVTPELKMQFQDSIYHADGLRQKIAEIFKESKKLDNLGELIDVSQAPVGQLEDLKVAMIGFANQLEGGTVEIKGFNQAGDQMYVTLRQSADAVKNITVALDGASGHLKAFNTGTKQVTNEWQDFKAQAVAGAKNLVGMYVGFQEGVQAVRTGLNYVKEIDLAMTELKKVTDETDASYKQFLKDAGSTSAVIGSTISDFTNASATFARLGYSLEESASMAETAIIYKNVADGLDSVEESSESIISTMMAFGIEASDTMSIIDRFNAVGNNFAITSAGIGDALKKSASALFSAGNTIDESVALVTAANSVIQNPEQVGTALKTLALRLRGAKVELEEAGLETDNMAESTSTLQAKLKALTHGKVDIMLDADTFKSTTQILREMSEAWEDMTDIERASALELMGGKRQANILSSVIQNFETVEDVIETSMNSSGSAMAENEKWLDSIEGKTYQFTNALQTMWSNMLNSEVIKDFIGFGTEAIQFLDTGAGKVIALVAALKLIAKFKGFSIGGIVKGLGDTINKITTAQQTLQALSQTTKLGKGYDLTNVNAYAQAVSNLTAKQQANLLASQGLNQEQIRYALTLNKVDDAAMREAMAHVHAASAKDQEVMSGNKLVQQKAMEVAASLKVQAAKDGETRSTELNAAADILEQATSEDLTRDKLVEIMTSKGISSATQAEILAKLGLTNANKGLAASIKALYVLNPVGFWITVGSTILSLIPIVSSLVDNFTESAEEIKKEANEISQAYSDAVNEINSNLQTLGATDSSSIMALEKEFEKLTAGVDRYGNNISLTSDQYSRYKEICEQIVGINPRIASGYDSATEAIGNNASALSQLIAFQKERARLAAEEYVNDENLETLTEDEVNDYKDAQKQRGKVGTKRTELFGMLSQGSTKETMEYILKTLGYGEAEIANTIERYYLYAMGDYDSSRFMVDFIDEIDKKYKNFDGHVDSLDDFFDEYENTIRAGEQSVEEAQDGLIDKLLIVPTSSKDYDKLTSEGKNFLTDWINNSEIFKMDSSTTAEDVQGMRDTILNMMDVLVSEAKTVNYDGEMLSAQDILGQIYNLDTSSVNYEDYKAQISAMLEAFWNSLSQDQKDQYGFADFESFKISFGFDFETEDNQIETAKNQVAGFLDMSLTEVQKKLDGMSAKEVKAFYSINWNAVGDDGVDTWQDVIDKIQTSIGGNTITVKTYSALAESVESYNDILTQTSEIVADNTEVTQEYKDSLVDLGISEEDLNECFDDANPLIVKNAKALNKLVKEANKGVAANVKLAKSQSRLEYYDLVKQLNSTLAGTRKLDNATRNSIYSTLEQIDAVEKAIYQYQLLEDALLGVNNAFDEFAEAQEIDSLNTYGDSYVEMAQTMYDALYKTGQVGTEQFWAAAEALVPTEVYQHLTEDADRMKAIYDYYNKYVLPSLKLDEDELSIDYTAIEQFVKRGLKNGVFEGDVENFDLVEGMNLDEAAEKLGYTKTQAYALFAELDKYNTGGNEHSFLSQLDDSLEGRITNITNGLEDLNKQKLALLESKPKVSAEVKSELEKLSEGGHVDLTLRPVIDSSELANAGWEEQAGEIATVFTSTFSNEAGNVAINFTPIVADENGNYIRTLSPEELQKYAEEVIAGVREDDLNLQIGAAFKGEDAIKQAEDAAEHIHELHEEYYAVDDDLNEINDKISKNEAELRKLGQEAYNTWQEYTKNDAAIAALSEIEDKTALLSEEGAKTLGLEWDEVKGQTIQQALDTLLAKQLELGEPTVLTAQLAIDNIDSQIAELKQKLKDSEKDPAVLGVEADADQTTIDAAKQKIEDQIQKLEEDKVVLATEFGIELTEEEKKTVEDELNAIEKIVIHDKEFTVIANGTSETMQTLRNINNYTIGNKSYTVTTRYQDVGKNTTRTPGSGGRYTKVDGTAHANGSWGAPRTETALVGELGPEMLVRNGRWTTVGDNGAEFTQVKKGDIIFNHKQTEDLLSKGYVTGRGKLKGGISAFASGTAYSGLWKPTSPDKPVSNKPGDDASDAGQKLYDAADSLSSAADDISSSASDATDEFREVFDWIEVRLEEIDDAINLKNAKLENKVGHKAQNKVIDDIIELNQNLYDNLIAGANKYYSYANKLLSKVPAEYREAAQDGTIAIETFVGEADEKTLEAIQEYREWVQKGDEAAQRAEETLTEISNLAKQAVDNIASDYDNKRSLRDNKIDQYEAYNALLETDKGFESAAIYQAMMKENNKIIETLEQQRDKMQEELNKRVESGEIKVGSQDWYDAVNDIAALDTEIIELKTDTENWQDAINELHWEKFDALMSRLESVSNEAENLISILSNDDMVDDSGNWTNEGITTLGLYAQQMEAAEVQAKKYQEEIDYLNANWQELGYTEEEYLEKLEELKNGQYDAIESYHDAKDAIVDLNKERIEAIKDGIQKEIDAYSELIEKKKEELDAEKDLYDFQKSIMEQEKDIADIQRQLAALSGDNSASARAKRAQLEAELAEAQAALEESYYERSMQNKQDALDKELENFQEEKDAEMESLDEYLNNTEQVVAESLATVQANTDAVYQTLQAMGQEYSLSITESLTSPWQEGSNAIQSFSEQFGISMSATIEELMELELQFKETMLEIEQAGIDAANAVKENAQGYTEAEYKEPEKEEKPKDDGDKKQEEKKIKVGGKINAKGAKIYDYVGDKSGSKQYYSSDPIYVVLDEKSGYLKVRHHKSKSGVTGWFKKSDVKAYAKGSFGVSEDQWALIDELGDELQLIPGKNGRLEYVKKGTGIVPADLTERLVNLAMDPQEMLDRNRPSVGVHPEIHHTEISIDNSVGELIHIDNCSTETLPDVKKIVDDALEKHMQKLNNSLRKYTR